MVVLHYWNRQNGTKPPFRVIQSGGELPEIEPGGDRRSESPNVRAYQPIPFIKILPDVTKMIYVPIFVVLFVQCRNTGFVTKYKMCKTFLSLIDKYEK